MDRQELIQTLIPGLVKSTSSTTRAVEGVLNTYEMDGLKKELARQRKLGYLQTPVEDIANDPDILRHVEAIRAEVRREYENNPERIGQRQEQEREAAEVYKDYALTQIFKIRVPGHGFAVRNKASESVIISWLNFDETLTVDWYLRVLSENPQLASGLQWTTNRNSEAQSLAQDQQIFNVAANSLRSFGMTEANFSLTRSILGPNFTYIEIQTAIADGRLQLSPPSQTERAEWAVSDIESHNVRVLQASATELRTMARQESAVRRAHQGQQQTEEAIAAAQDRDSHRGFPPLPVAWNGQSLDANFIRKCDAKTHRLLAARFGLGQLNSRLAGKG